MASRATGTLILSQSNNAAAGTNRELFNSHQLMLCHQVLLCAFPILILCISRISFAFIFIAQMLERQGWGHRGNINADICARLLKWASMNGVTLYFHTQQRWIDTPYPAASLQPPCLYTQKNIYALRIMYIFACRHHWVSASVRVCVSQRGSVSVWVVSTRNNTLPWDLLNGHHLSLSAKALGKLMLRLRCFFTSGPAKMNWHPYAGRLHCEKKTKH